MLSLLVRGLVAVAALSVVLACGGGERDPGSAVTQPPAGGAVDAGFPPTVQVTAPAEDVRVAPGVRVKVEWSGTAGAGAAQTEVFADVDGDLATTDDQWRISEALEALEADGRGRSAEWNTQDVPLGRYLVIARIVGGAFTVTAQAAGVVEVVEPRLTVENLEPEERLRFPLALVTGSAHATSNDVRVTAARMTATGSTSAPTQPERTWPARAGRFKALVPLEEGHNVLTLVADGVRHRFELRYEPIHNPRFVRFLYVLSSDGDGTFDAPGGEPNDVESAKQRIATTAELMQTFTAEALHAQGLGRRTFRVARDAEGLPIVETFRSTLTTAQARSMDGLALWQHFYGELGALPEREQTIDVVIMSMTHWDAAKQEALAHTALGGGRLALFGSGALHTWAQSVDEVVARFSDDRFIDTSQLFDDSAYRGTYWANYATGAGATLHELGHCLSLPHPANGKGVMAREFDHFNRTFMVTEPLSNGAAGLDPVLPSHEIGWDRSGAVRLRFHRWLEPEARTYATQVAPSLIENSSSVTVQSAPGLRHIAWHVDGNVAGHEEFLTEPPPSFSVTKAALKARFPGAAAVRATAIDDDGNIGEREIPLP